MQRSFTRSLSFRVAPPSDSSTTTKVNMTSGKILLSAPPSPTQSTTSAMGLSGHGSDHPYAVNLAPKQTLYERMGGEPAINALTAAFFMEIGKVQGLAHFFVNVPVAAIQMHQGQFFKVLFGADEEKPTADELLDYMILTHVRLFRDLGLDASHFDLVAVCFIDAMNQMKVPANLQDECLAIVGPLRVAFDYGAAVARRERIMSRNTFKEAPLATMKTMRTDTEAKLPAGLEPPPSWLVEFLGGRDNVRAWTGALTYRLVVADEDLAGTFFTLPYLEMEPYCHALLQMAFANSMGINTRLPLSVLRTVRFPCGLTKPNLQLTKGDFEKIAQHFFEVGLELGQKDQCWMIPEELGEITDALRQRRAMFVGTEPTCRMSTLARHHRLRHDPSQAPCHSLEQQLEAKEKDYEEMMNKGKKSKKSKGRSSKKSEEAPPKSKGSWWFRWLAQTKAKNTKTIDVQSAREERIQI
eukprot:scaffold2915_cov181-Amphora_coffeaeformis.AAC.5